VACHAQLQAPEYYGHLIFFGSILLAALLSTVLGFRGFNALFFVVAIFFPIVFLAARLVPYVIPPKIEMYLPEGASLNLRR
jgi:hypothetical protein